MCSLYSGKQRRGGDHMGQIHNTVYEYDPEEARIMTWFSKGLRHEWMRLGKKQKKQQLHELLILNRKITNNGNEVTEIINTISCDANTTSEAIQTVFIEDMLSQLTSQQQAVIVSTVLNDVPEKDVANEMGVSQPSVNKMKHRALKQLRKYLLLDPDGS